MNLIGIPQKLAGYGSHTKKLSRRRSAGTNDVKRVPAGAEGTGKAGAETSKQAAADAVRQLAEEGLARPA